MAACASRVTINASAECTGFRRVITSVPPITMIAASM
jgi:hypothetical protein